MHENLEINELLGSLAESMGVSHLKLGENHMCIFQYKESLDFLIMVPPMGESVYLAATICKINPESKGELYERVLTMNFLLMETRGTTFAIDQESMSIVICYERSLKSLTRETFPDLVGNFLITAEELKQKLEEVPPKTHGSELFLDKSITPLNKI